MSASDPVPRRRRNPRRAYDANGQMLAPPTVGSSCADGETTVQAWCIACDHSAVVPIDALPADLPIPDIALRLRCTACGSRRIEVRKDMDAHYARMRKDYGWRAGG